MGGAYSYMLVNMGKRRISATIDPDILDRAVALTGETNVSSLLEEALRQLIDHRLEQRWLAGHDDSADRPTPTYDLAHSPWGDADAQG